MTAWETIPQEDLGPVHHRHVGHDDCRAAGVALVHAVCVQVAHPGLVHQAQHGIVAQVPTVIQIGNTHIKLRCERKIQGQFNSDASHGADYSPWDRIPPRVRIYPHSAGGRICDRRAISFSFNARR